MTLQAKGFQWSVGIHGMLVLAVAVLQSLAVSQTGITVIDFTLPGNDAPAAAMLASPDRQVAAKQEVKPAALPPKESIKSAIRKETVREAAIERESRPPGPELSSAPSEVSERAEEDAAALSPEAPGPGSSPDPRAGSLLSALRSADTAGARSAGAALTGSGEDSGPIHGAKGGGPGDAGAGASADASRAAYLKKHFVYIRDRITGGISYPAVARKMGWCGQVKIAFIVCEDGGVNDVKILESSGFGLLDRNAVDTVKNVAPFPAPPVRAEIRMAITYRLN